VPTAKDIIYNKLKLIRNLSFYTKIWEGMVEGNCICWGKRVYIIRYSLDKLLLMALPRLKP